MSITSSSAEPPEQNLPAMGPQDFSAANDWPGYFGAVLGKPPRDTLLAALAAFDGEGVTTGLAVDLAAGEGRDTLELLARGWRVLATDAEPAAFAYLWPRVPGASRADRAHHTHEDVLALLAAFDLEVMRIEERDDPPDVREPKHWHLFHVVARKR